MSLELLLIFGVTLMVFGPQKLPMLAKHVVLLNKTIRRYQQKWRTLQRQITQEAGLQIREQQAIEAETQQKQPIEKSTN